MEYGHKNNNVPVWLTSLVIPRELLSSYSLSNYGAGLVRF